LRDYGLHFTPQGEILTCFFQLLQAIKICRRCFIQFRLMLLTVARKILVGFFLGIPVA